MRTPQLVVRSTVSQLVHQHLELAPNNATLHWFRKGSELGLVPTPQS